MSIYDNLKDNDQCKASTGSSLDEFNLLFNTFKKLYTPKKANPYRTSNRPVLTNKREALFFILHYIKAYPTLQNMGLYSGFSNATASDYIGLLKPVLKKFLVEIILQTVRIFKDQASFDNSFEGVTEMIIDVTEDSAKTPVNQGFQK